jgi:hypothetical protein
MPDLRSRSANLPVTNDGFAGLTGAGNSREITSSMCGK